MTDEIILLAGGKGSRLRSVLAATPKCLAPVNGQPFLQYLIQHYQQQGVRHFIFALGYLHELVEAYLEQQFPSLGKTIFIEGKPLDTGGAVRQSLAGVHGSSAFIANADTFIDVDLARMQEVYQRQRAKCTIAVQRVDHAGRFGTVIMNDEQRVTSFAEKQREGSGLINAGLYLIEKENFLQQTVDGTFSFERDYLVSATLRGEVFGVLTDGRFLDIGVPEDLARAEGMLSSLPANNNQ
jgi:D-glycero-alpha-D-manno-heptose 1-phosphate guanylyltransferase